MIAVKPLMQTSEGYEVSGCQRAYTPATNDYDRISGRVRVVKDDPSKDDIVDWDLDGKPKQHRYGWLVNRAGVSNEAVNHHNLFSDLVRGRR